MSNYWQKRLGEEQDALYNKTLKEAQNKLKEYYTHALKEVSNDISKLYDKLAKESLTDEIAINDLYRYNRYFELTNKLNKNLTSLGAKEIEIHNATYKQLYELTGQLIGDTFKLPISAPTAIVDDLATEEILKNVWCADGKHWSDRIWSNTKKLQTRLEKGMIDSISRGIPKDELVKQLEKDFAVGIHSSDRIVRTELTNVQNQAAADRYKKANVTHYEYVAALDSRTSDICAQLDGKIFSFNEGIVGVNMPPMHVNCRSTIVPVIK